MQIKPRLCIVGSLVGQNGGLVTTQGQIVAELFRKAGYAVSTTSAKVNRAARLAEIVWTIFSRRHTTDVLIVEVYSGLGFIVADIAGILAKTLKIPAIFVLHGGGLPDFIERFPNWVNRTLRRADILVAPSLYMANKIRKHGHRVTVIPNVVRIDAYPTRIRRKISPKLIWMRSFHPVYNPQMALDVLAAIKSEYPNASLVMAGVDKGLKSRIKDSAKLMHLDDSVRFPGFLDESGKIKEFSRADIYLNTNRIDNMPVSVIEACAMGLPVIATDVGGISHLITTGETGLLVPDGDVEQMADAIRTLLNSPELTERISRAGRAMAENSSWENVQTLWQKLFISLNDKNAKTSRSRIGLRSKHSYDQ